MFCLKCHCDFQKKLIRLFCIFALCITCTSYQPPILCISPYAPLFPSPSDGLAAFRSFLQSEFSDENIEFWMACEDFKKTKNPVKMTAKAKKIYEDFIQSEGPREVRDSCDFPLFDKISVIWNRKR